MKKKYWGDIGQREILSKKTNFFFILIHFHRTWFFKYKKGRLHSMKTFIFFLEKRLTVFNKFKLHDYSKNPAKIVKVQPKKQNNCALALLDLSTLCHRKS